MKKIKIVAIMFLGAGIFAGCQKSNLTPISSTSDFTNLERRPLTDFLIPENFVEGVDNTYFPLTIGDTLFYETVEVEDGVTVFQESYMTATGDIKVIAGINCMVVHDIATIDGALLEDTYDWFAQDIYGNVWYFGEDTKKYAEDGSFSTAGSFEHGVDGASAGIVMLADPASHIGFGYKQEDFSGEAEDRAQIISVDETITIDYGTFTHCVKTLETTPLDPGVKEYKFYAPGIGQIMANIPIGGAEHNELVDIH